MAPGATALTLILCLDKSKAKEAVKDTIALFDVAYANIFLTPLILFMEAKFMMEDLLLFLSNGRIYLHAKKVPVTLLLK
jgi:hypothetical protein